MVLQVLASLAQHELPSEHLALMHSTAARGQVLSNSATSLL